MSQTKEDQPTENISEPIDPEHGQVVPMQAAKKRRGKASREEDHETEPEAATCGIKCILS